MRKLLSKQGFTGFRAALILPILLASVAARAGSISGTVHNATTGKPATGDDVILIKLAEGMQEETRTKTDADGRYKLDFPDDNGPHLVRVIHQKALYHQPAPPGVSHVDVEVFDVAAKLAEVTGTVNIVRMQTDATGLQVTEMYALKNASSPPRTQFSDRSFEIFLPANASIDSGMAEGPGGMPVKAAPVPMAEKGHYAFIFPVRPGETQFQVSYHMPYSGSANFAPRLLYPTENLAVMLPKSMTFTPAKPGSYSPAVDENGVAVQVAKNVGPGAAPAFRVSGSGEIPQNALGDNQSAGPASPDGASAQASAPSSRPGGGLGNPEGGADPLQNYRWLVVGVILAVLMAGAFWITNRQPAPATVNAAAPSFAPTASPERTAAPTPRLGTSNPLMDALKDEMFQLETEKLEKKISPEEYAKTKAALEQTLLRAMQRNKKS